MSNPVTLALKVSGTKPIDLARELQLSRQYISRAELGCHVNLSSRLVQWVAMTLSSYFNETVKPSQVHQLYKAFQKLTRLRHPVAKKKLPGKSAYEFINWRKTNFRTRYEFAVALCIHPASVDAYEERTTVIRPKQIQELFECLETYQLMELSSKMRSES